MEGIISKLHEIVRKNFVLLLTSDLNMRELFDKLYSKSIISFYDYDSLISKTTVNRNEEFFLNLDMYEPQVSRDFVIWIKEKYEFLFDELCKTEIEVISPHVSPEELIKRSRDQDLIRTNFTLLLRRINANAIAPQLYQDGFLDRDGFESVMIQPTRIKRGFELITKLIGRLKSTQIKLGLLESFTKALKQHQPHLYEVFTLRCLSQQTPADA